MGSLVNQKPVFEPRQNCLILKFWISLAWDFCFVPAASAPFEAAFLTAKLKLRTGHFTSRGSKNFSQTRAILLRGSGITQKAEKFLASPVCTRNWRNRKNAKNVRAFVGFPGHLGGPRLHIGRPTNIRKIRISNTNLSIPAF